MLKTIVLVTLFVISPYASGAHAHCPTVPKKDNTNRPHPELQQLVIEIHALQQSLPGLTSAVNRLAVATENSNIKPIEPIAPPPPDPAIDSSGWLTLLAILIALSAYMANLRWTLIDKCGKENRRQGFYQSRIASIDKESSKLGIADEKKEKKEELADEKSDLEEKNSKSKKLYRAHQIGIRWVSVVDAFLVFSSVFIFLHLFLDYLLTPPWSLVRVALWSFAVAALVFIGLHAREWCKAICKMNLRRP